MTAVENQIDVEPGKAFFRKLLKKNQDAQKLRNFGSKLTEAFAADHCPTCSQPIQDTLLAQQASAAVMPIEDNIEYIRSQRAIFQRLDAQLEASVAN
ncbi:MAG TPA: hypothetical protein VFR21_10490, partial [Bradyrhizobium sp.]|nr:hypothetical protein [Bradyrhizobium sp.]